MQHKLKDYRRIVGNKTIDQILEESTSIIGKHVVNISSTFYGGGVAEYLGSLIPLLDDTGLHVGWRVLKGEDEFFHVTKKLHHALQGANGVLSNEEKSIWVNQNKYNASFTHLNHDAVIVHDAQPLPLINCYKKRQPWIWRCHVDLSNPGKIWPYVRKFVNQYDYAIFHTKDFMRNDIRPKQIIHQPSIDPLSAKNIPMNNTKIRRILKKYGIDRDKPIITQISRFDKWKDPEGVIETYKLIKRDIDCRLVLLGSFATDDPEGEAIYRKLIKFDQEDDDVHVIGIKDDHLVNALQRESEVIIQKSLREGFGLTVSEALYKGTPVIAGRVGGIKLQVKSGWNGYLVNPSNIKETAKMTKKLLLNDRLRRSMGKNGKKYVEDNFLVTSNVLEWVRLLKKIL